MGQLERPSFGQTLVLATFATVPIVGGPLAEFGRYFMELDRWAGERRRQRAQDVGEGIDEECQDDAERIVERTMGDERLLRVLQQALEAGMRSPWQEKRRTLGRVAGQALRDGADIDQHAALLAALAALEAPHIRLLEEIRAGHRNESADGSATVPEPWRAGLIATGTVHLQTTYNGDPLIDSVTPFGHELLEWLRDAVPPGGVGEDTLPGGQ